MKTIQQINQNLEQFEKQYGFKVLGATQGSGIWMNLKLGVISASKIDCVVAKKDSEKRNTYMCELVGQIATGQLEEINSKYLDWGRDHESAARALYEFQTDTKIEKLLFVYADETRREGCSPDGLVSSELMKHFSSVEIKCPFNPVHYIKFLIDGDLKTEYLWQYQHTLRVLELDSMDFVQYHPLMKKQQMKILTVGRDAEKQKKMADAIPEFISDMDDMLKKLGLKFGDQWERLREV